MGKYTEEAYELLEAMASNNYQWSNDRGMPKRTPGVYDVDGMNMLNAKVDNLVKLFGKLGNVNSVSDFSPVLSCDLCGGTHNSSDCMQTEQAQFVGNFNRQQNNPYSQTYNPGWRNHPNFSWKDQGNQSGISNSRPFPPPGFQQKPQPEGPASWELAIEKLANATSERFERLEAKVDQMASSSRNVEMQLGQLANSINSRGQGSLPSKTEINPREQCKAVTLRSRKQYGEVSGETVVDDEVGDEDVRNQDIEEVEESIKTPPVKPYVPPIPFPQRLKQTKLDKQFEKFLAAFKQLSVNIPFADALAQIPAYGKFLKEIMANKRKLEDYETIALTEECSAVIQNKLPPKLRDPGSFSIHCTIGDVELSRALCDLGASVSLIPLSVCRKLGLKEMKPTNISLQLADRSVKYPLGVLENVLVKVKKFIIPVDLIVLKMEEDAEISIILGRPFLATAGAVIDVKNGRLAFKVGEEEVEFNFFH